MFSYEISLSDSSLPSNWIIEFSDPVMGNKYNSIDYANINVIGRDCGNGINNFGVISSQHDRKFIWGDSFHNLGPNAWGRGACTSHPDEEVVFCNGEFDSVSILLLASNNSISLKFFLLLK